MSPLHARFYLFRPAVQRSVVALALGLGLLTPVAMMAAYAADGSIQGLRYDTATHNVLIEATGTVKAAVHTLTIAGQNRVIIDLQNAEIGSRLPGDAELKAQLAPVIPGLRGVSVTQYQSEQGGPMVRIMLDLDGYHGDVGMAQTRGSTVALRVNPTPPSVDADTPSILPPPTIVSTPAAKPVQSERLAAAAISPAPLSASRNETQLSEMKRALLNMNARLETLTEENRQLKGKLANGQTATQATALASAQADIVRLNRENADLTSRLQQALSKPDTTGQLASLQGEISDLRQENARLKASAEAALHKPAATPPSGKELASLKAQLTLAQKSLTDSIETITAQNREIAALRGQVSGVKAGMDASAREQLSGLQHDLEEKDARINDLQKQLAANAGASSAVTMSAVSQPSGDAERLYAEARAAMKAGNASTANNKFSQALALDPDNGRLVQDATSALGEERRYAEAIDILRAYLQRNPSDRDIYNQLGKIYLLNDQADAASQAFNRAISTSTLNNYATSLKKLGKISEAESTFKLALMMNPGDSEVYFNLGNLYNSANKPTEARDNYLQAIRIRPDFAEAHYNLGLAYAKAGDKANAVTHLEKFLQLSPKAANAPVVKNYIAKLKTG